MSPLLKEYLNKRIVLITTNGESFVGTLEGFDKSTNLIVSNLTLRFQSNRSDIISSVQLLRGSEIVACGLYDPNESDIELEKQRSMKDFPIHDTKNKIMNEHIIWKKVYENKLHSVTKRRKTMQR